MLPQVATVNQNTHCPGSRIILISLQTPPKILLICQHKHWSYSLNRQTINFNSFYASSIPFRVNLNLPQMQSRPTKEQKPKQLLCFQRLSRKLPQDSSLSSVIQASDKHMCTQGLLIITSLLMQLENDRLIPLIRNCKAMACVMT